MSKIKIPSFLWLLFYIIFCLKNALNLLDLTSEFHTVVMYVIVDLQKYFISTV